MAQLAELKDVMREVTGSNSVQATYIIFPAINQGWALRSFPFSMLRSFSFLKKIVL